MPRTSPVVIAAALALICAPHASRAQKPSDGLLGGYGRMLRDTARPHGGATAPTATYKSAVSARMATWLSKFHDKMRKQH